MSSPPPLPLLGANLEAQHRQRPALLDAQPNDSNHRLGPGGFGAVSRVKANSGPPAYQKYGLGVVWLVATYRVSLGAFFCIFFLGAWSRSTWHKTCLGIGNRSPQRTHLFWARKGGGVGGWGGGVPSTRKTRLALKALPLEERGRGEHPLQLVNAARIGGVG